MASLKKSYCHLCFYVESQDRPIIKLACNHTICIVCNTETYCALCRLSKYFMYSINCIARRVKCTVSWMWPDYFKGKVNDEIDKIIKKQRIVYTSPSLLPFPIIHNEPLLNDVEIVQICNENCSIDEDETYRIKDIMTRSPLPSIQFDDIDFDEIF